MGLSLLLFFTSKLAFGSLNMVWFPLVYFGFHMAADVTKEKAVTNSVGVTLLYTFFSLWGVSSVFFLIYTIMAIADHSFTFNTVILMIILACYIASNIMSYLYFTAYRVSVLLNGDQPLLGNNV